MLVIKQYFFPYCGSQWGPATVWFSEFFLISSFMFKKETYTGLLNYVNDDKILILGGTIPLSQQKKYLIVRVFNYN